MTSDATTEVERITGALRKLLAEMLRQDRLRRKARKDDDSPLRAVSAADFSREPLPTRRQAQIDALLKNPVRAACKNAVRLLGERLHELGLDLDEMQTVARLASRGLAFSKRMNIVDKSWHGIGTWLA
jgi:hypothetical protein